VDDSTKGTVVLCGALAQRPVVAGHAWVFLNWLLGLRAAGYDVLFVDRLDASMLDDALVPLTLSRQYQWLEHALGSVGLDGCAVVIDGRDGSCVGMKRSELRSRCSGAVAVLNVMGYIDDPDVVSTVGPRVFVDIDPGFGQFWKALGWHDLFDGHDAIVSVGLTLDRADCVVPSVGLPLVTTVPPVSLEFWKPTPAPALARVRATSVCTWRGPFAPIEHDGVRYGLRVHSLRELRELPQMAMGIDIELALAIDDGEQAELDTFASFGWHFRDPEVATDLWSYRRYIRSSSAELMVAKEMYVRSRGGWFSDRSACYLAAGRPVVAQDTGFSLVLPVGEGLFAFHDVATAADALAAVADNTDRHAKAASTLAADLFDGRRVMQSVLDRLGVAA
jgi:hypothetical protein